MLEIDFLIQSEGITHAIECKWSEIPKQSDTDAIIELQGYLNKKPNPSLAKMVGHLICRTPEVHPFANGINALPITDLHHIVVQ
jgi:hypothetical protein